MDVGCKPVGKPNFMHQTILGYLVDNKRGLAKNVSWLNVDRAAARWATT